MKSLQTNGDSSRCHWQGELKMHQNWMKNNYSIHLSNMQDFGIWDPFRHLSEIKFRIWATFKTPFQEKILHGASITHKDAHLN